MGKMIEKIRKIVLGDKMGKLVIENGRLVREDALPVQQELEPTIIAETKQKVIPKSEVNKRVPEPQEVYQQAVKFAEEVEPETVEEVVQPVVEEVVPEVEEIIEQATERKVDTNLSEHVTFIIMLVSGAKLPIKILREDAKDFYEFINLELKKAPVLQIEKKLIPVSSIEAVYFE